ncbi:RNA helicase [Ephemerocybe angulata]|uniref:RNA helicase n=1 Tax=Ephemerocybe angulata TaxID=980116 RepID=A0A8H6I2S4_9AGAR|nr:RNA helicase [Tulosesus angulatus]
MHLESRRHRHRTATGRSPTESYHCSICQKNILSACWASHIAGKAHRSLAELQGASPAIEPLPGLSNDVQTYCPLCRIAYPRAHWTNHVQGKVHKSKVAFMAYRSVLDEAEKDKNGVSVEGSTDLGYIEPPNADWHGRVATITLKSSEAAGKSSLVKAELASMQGSRRVNTGFSVVTATLGTAITLRSPATVTFKFKERFIGRYDDRLELTFKDAQLNKIFIISRPVGAIIGSEVDHEALKPISPYIDPRLRSGGRAARAPVSKVIEGVAPPSANAVNYVLPLPRAAMPKHLLDLLSVAEQGGSLKQLIGDVRKIFMPNVLNSATYARHFKCLLWAEEFRTEADLARYDMLGVTLSKHNRYYYLAIPGLAEKRPSVLVGDRMLVQRQDAPSGQWLEGHVHVVRQSEVGLCFHSSFSAWSLSQKYNVRFKLNRIVLRRQHQALDSAFEEDRIFFPLQKHLSHTTSLGASQNPGLAYYNPLIGSNERQSLAVKSIANLPEGSAPFIVFGPPGTGKTVTIVEAIRQILKASPSARILACAPSNSAADLIAERLASSLSPQDLFRMYAPSRSKETVPDALTDYAYLASQSFGAIEKQCFGVPPLDQLQAYKVVVSTCVAASMLAGVGVHRGHFQWVFVDEAGQATEPEVCVPVKSLADGRMNVVLGGDPKQLGPIVRSAVARALGLEKSWLERLMEREEVYDVQEQRGVVKLTQNFRSHPAILKFPNERFYGGDLVPCADAATTNAYLGAPILPKGDFPVVFHAVLGRDDREASSPSFFNVDEVLQVKSYVQQLKDGRGKLRTNDNDVGVIAPYHAQCLKLRTALRSVADGIKVGSVEEFQGQERKVIIISTVRSSKEFVTYDLKHTLGFVANPRRFNVSITRAKALLIIVGNPHVLGLDPLWRSFLNYIHLNGGWVGPDIPWDPKETVDDAGGDEYGARVRREAEVDMNELARRMEGEVSMGEGGEGEGDVNVDRPWRDVE